MTPCVSANRRPLCDAKLAEAAEKPPVWSHTMTGAGCVGGGSLTHRFSFRQSSDPVGEPVKRVGQLGGGVVAGSTDGDHGEIGRASCRERVEDAVVGATL